MGTGKTVCHRSSTSAPSLNLCEINHYHLRGSISLCPPGAAPAAKKWDGHASGASKKWGSGGLLPENFLGPRPPERRKTPLMQDRIKILFIIDFTFWTLFASHNSLQTTNEKEKVELNVSLKLLSHEQMNILN